MPFFCSVEHKKKIFWRMLVTKQLLVATDLWNIFFHTMEVNGYHQLFGYQHSSKYLLLCSTEQRSSYRCGATWTWTKFELEWKMLFSIFCTAFWDTSVRLDLKVLKYVKWSCTESTVFVVVTETLIKLSIVYIKQTHRHTVWKPSGSCTVYLVPIAL